MWLLFQFNMRNLKKCVDAIFHSSCDVRESVDGSNVLQSRQ